MSIDPDVVTGDPDFRRIKKSQKPFFYYRFQHVSETTQHSVSTFLILDSLVQLYVPFVYGFLITKARMNDFIIMFVSKMDGAIRLLPPSTFELATFILGKVFFVTYRILIPMYFFGWQRSLGMLMISDLTLSYHLAFIFQLNHVVAETIWPQPNEKGEIEMDWAEMQVR
jgi:hypothetical protein